MRRPRELRSPNRYLLDRQAQHSLGDLMQEKAALVAVCRRCKHRRLLLTPNLVERLGTASACSSCGACCVVGNAEPLAWPTCMRPPGRGMQWVRPQPLGPPSVCNLYSLQKSRAAIGGLFRVSDNRMPVIDPLPGIFPNYNAPVVRHAADGEREIVIMNWGFPLLQPGKAPSASPTCGTTRSSSARSGVRHSNSGAAWCRPARSASPTAT